MLGTRITALRISAGMRQAELAKKAGVSASTIGMYEQGRREPSGQRLIVLARLLGVTADYLLTGKPVCAADRAALDRVAQSGAAAAQRRRSAEPFTGPEIQVLLSVMAEEL